MCMILLLQLLAKDKEQEDARLAAALAEAQRREAAVLSLQKSIEDVHRDFAAKSFAKAERMVALKSQEVAIMNRAEDMGLDAHVVVHNMERQRKAKTRARSEQEAIESRKLEIVNRVRDEMKRKEKTIEKRPLPSSSPAQRIIDAVKAEEYIKSRTMGSTVILDDESERHPSKIVEKDAKPMVYIDDQDVGSRGQSAVGGVRFVDETRASTAPANIERGVNKPPRKPAIKSRHIPNGPGGFVWKPNEILFSDYEYGQDATFKVCMMQSIMIDSSLSQTSLDH